MPIYPNALNRLSQSLRSPQAGITLPAASNAFAWFAADDIPAQTDSTTLNTWTDRINGIVASAPATGTLPKYRAGRLNGKQSVQFSGSNCRISIGRPTAFLNGWTGTRATAIFVFYNQVASPRAAGGPFGNASSGPTGCSWSTCDGRRVGGVSYGGTGTCGPYTSAGLTVLIQTVDGVSSPTRGRTYVNGTSRGGGAGVASVPGGTGNYVLGSTGDTTTYGYEFSGELLHAVFLQGVTYTQVQVMQAVKAFFDYYGQPYPWAGRSFFEIYVGDSIVSDIGTSGGGLADEFTFPYISAVTDRSFQDGWWSNVGVPSLTLPNMEGVAQLDVDGLGAVLGMPIHILLSEYANSRGGTGVGGAGGTDPTNLINALKSVASNRKTAQPNCRVVLCTSTALGGSAGNGDQNSDGSTSTYGTYRTNFDAAVRTLSSSYDGLCDFGANANVGAIGANPYSATYPTTYFYDATHPNASPGGRRVMATIVTSTMSGLPT